MSRKISPGPAGVDETGTGIEFSLSILVGLEVTVIVFRLNILVWALRWGPVPGSGRMRHGYGTGVHDDAHRAYGGRVCMGCVV